MLDIALALLGAGVALSRVPRVSRGRHERR
jgi:hypothetical protein